MASAESCSAGTACAAIAAALVAELFPSPKLPFQELIVARLSVSETDARIPTIPAAHKKSPAIAGLCALPAFMESPVSPICIN